MPLYCTLASLAFSFFNFLSAFWLLYSFTLNPRSGIVSPKRVESVVDFPFPPGKDVPTTGSSPDTKDFRSLEPFLAFTESVLAALGSQDGGVSSFCISLRQCSFYKENRDKTPDQNNSLHVY